MLKSHTTGVESYTSIVMFRKADLDKRYTRCTSRVLLKKYDVCRTSYLSIGMGRRVLHSDLALLLEQRLTNTRQIRLRQRRGILHLG